LAAGAETTPQQAVYFAGDFLLDRFGRFFFVGVERWFLDGPQRQTAR